MRYYASILIGALLFSFGARALTDTQIFLPVVQQAGVPDPATTPQMGIEWQPAAINVELFRGTSKIVIIEMQASNTAEGVSLKSSSGISQLLTIESTGLVSVTAGGIYAFAAIIDIPKSVQIGTYHGEVKLAVNDVDVQQFLPVSVHVIEP